MCKILISSAIGALLVAYVAATCLVCPQILPDDTQLPVCASNSFGNTNVTESAIANWDCLHPYNKYTVISSSPCPVVNNTCGANNCTNVGPAVCGKQYGKGIFGFDKLYTTTEFANVCQLHYYNCVHPTKAYTVTDNFECKYKAI